MLHFYNLHINEQCNIYISGSGCLPMPALVVEVTDLVPGQVIPKMGSDCSLLSNQSK